MNIVARHRTVVLALFTVVAGLASPAAHGGFFEDVVRALQQPTRGQSQQPSTGTVDDEQPPTFTEPTGGQVAEGAAPEALGSAESESPEGATDVPEGDASKPDRDPESEQAPADYNELIVLPELQVEQTGPIDNNQPKPFSGGSESAAPAQ